MLIDWDRINSLIDSDSEEDKAWLKDMIDTLLKNMEERIVNIQIYTKDSDHVKLKSELHQVKGVASNFGLMDLYELVIKSESLIHENQFDEAFQLSNSILDIWNLTKTEIIKH